MTSSVRLDPAQLEPRTLDRFAVALPARNHAVPYLIVLIVLLLCLRQDNVVPSTGLGLSPAYLLALLAGIWWLLGKALRLTGIGSGCLPVRFAIGGQLLAQFIGFLVLLEHPGFADPAQTPPLLVPAILAGLALFVLDTVHSWAELDRIVRWLVIAGSVGALLAVLEVVGHVDLAAITPPGLRAIPELVQPIPRDGITRAQGTAAHPLELAAVMTVLVPPAGYCLLAARARGQRWWPWLLPLALIGAAAVLSVSRSFFVGLAVEFVVLALYWPLRRTAATLGAAIGVLLVVMLVKDNVVSMFVGLFTEGTGDDSSLHRTLARQVAFGLIGRHPLLGTGLGSYDTSRFPVLDNQYLGVLVETGLVGLAGFLFLLGAGSYSALRTRARFDVIGWRDRDLGAALGASIAGYAVVNLILDTSGFLQISALAAVLVGLTGVLHRLRRDPLAARTA
ncbi:MAG TPA: O-antigen ligase family protein [Pseudonocardiaceae bacterium]|nr:O-antigen ligase family protein [Pseudonocardiaceae bacterium]